jgi:hypothetical protein
VLKKTCLVAEVGLRKELNCTVNGGQAQASRVKMESGELTLGKKDEHRIDWLRLANQKKTVCSARRHCVIMQSPEDFPPQQESSGKSSRRKKCPGRCF